MAVWFKRLIVLAVVAALAYGMAEHNRRMWGWMIDDMQQRAGVK